jgi:type IV pilus assembly protein PilE
MARQRGVTLIELMVVVVIVAIIASIAVPSYRQYLLRTQRADGKTELQRISTAQEKFFLQSKRYATDAELEAAPPNGLGIGRTSEHGHFALDLPNVGGVTYTARATAVGDQLADMPCRTFTIDSLGQKGATNGAGADNTITCWK